MEGFSVKSPDIKLKSGSRWSGEKARHHETKLEGTKKEEKSGKAKKEDKEESLQGEKPIGLYAHAQFGGGGGGGGGQDYDRGPEYSSDGHGWFYLCLFPVIIAVLIFGYWFMPKTSTWCGDCGSGGFIGGGGDGSPMFIIATVVVVGVLILFAVAYQRQMAQQEAKYQNAAVMISLVVVALAIGFFLMHGVGHRPSFSLGSPSSSCGPSVSRSVNVSLNNWRVPDKIRILKICAMWLLVFVLIMATILFIQWQRTTHGTGPGGHHHHAGGPPPAPAAGAGGAQPPGWQRRNWGGQHFRRTDQPPAF